MDFHALAQLKAQSKNNSKSAQHEVAQQFESVLVQMLLKSMRDANKAFSNGNEMTSGGEMYQDLFDKQVALSMSMSTKGIGLGKSIENYLDRVTPKPVEKALTKIDFERIPSQKTPLQQSSHEKISSAVIAKAEPIINKTQFEDEFDFVKSLWTYAKQAASSLGLDPKLLVAQVALETGWGKRIIADADKGSSHNVFNIKADSSWDKELVVKDTLEEKEGVFVKEKGKFRAYPSFAESFNDYVHFIKNNPRYHEALKAGANPDTYVRLLQKANYATDSRYSEKIMSIYNGEHLKNLCNRAELT